MRLARLAGAQQDVLELAPGDLNKQAAIGGVLLTTALVAFASAAFALNTALQLPLVACVVVGLAWGVVILNLDRMLVIGIGRMSGMWRNIISTLPRLMLAVVIGTVISTPLVLRIFQPEIDSELQLMHSEALIASQQKLSERFARIQDLEAQETKLQDVLAGRTVGKASEDPDVKAATAAYDRANQVYLEADRSAKCEYDGSCGSRVPGDGEAYRQKLAAANEARTARDTAKSKLDAVTGEAEKRASEGQTTDVEKARHDLGGVQDELKRLREEKIGAETSASKAEQANTGLLARLEALSRLTENRPMAQLAHLALFLLFLCLELLPVLVKILMSTGPETLYDRLVARREADANTADEVWSRKQTQIAEARSNVRVELELDRAAAQIEAGKRANAALVDAQSEIAQKAIDTWARVAAARSDEELARWYQQHTAPQPSPDTTMPISVQWPTTTALPQTNGHQLTPPTRAN
jgi:hypothetical protein